MPWLMRAEPWDAAAGALRPLYYSDEGFLSEPTDVPADTYWERRIDVPLSISASLYKDAAVGGEGAVSLGRITLANADGALDDLAGLDWDGRLVEVRWTDKASPVWADYAVVWSGTADSVVPGDTFQIELRDLKALLDEPFQPRKWAGTGGAEGPAALKDQRKPLTLGLAQQVEPVLCDGGNLLLAYSDGPSGGVLRLCDRGRPLVAGPDYPTAEALVAASLTGYGYATCDALGLVGLKVAVDSPVTADVIGRTRGSSLASNGRISMSATGWTLGGGWSYANPALLSSDSPLEAGWAVTGIASRVASAGLYGDGRACLLTESTSTGQHSVASAALAYAAGSQTTLQVKARAVAGAPCLQLLFGGSTHGSNAWANFDLASGLVGSKGSAATSTIIPLGGGTYLCAMTAPVTAAGSNPAYAIIAQTAAVGRSPSHAGAGRQIELQDIQIEAAPAASDYGGRLVSAAGSAGAASQAVATVPGRFYVVKAMVTRTAGSFGLQINGDSPPMVSASGRQLRTFQATGPTTTVGVVGDAAFAGTLDNLAVVEWLARFGDLAEWIIPQATKLTAADLAPGTVDAVNAAAGQALGLWYGGGDERTVRQVLDGMANGIRAWFAFDDGRKLRLGRFTGPAAVPDFEFTDRDVFSLQPRPPVRRLKAQTVGYGQRWRPLSEQEIAAAVLGDERVALGQPWRTEVASRPAGAAASLLAREERVDTAMAYQADAAAEAQSLLDLYGPTRGVYDAVVNFTPGLRVGMTIRLADRRFGLVAGKLLVVLSLDGDAARNRHAIVGWG